MSTITAADLKTVLSMAVQAARADNQMAVFEKEIIDRISDTLALDDAEKAELIDLRPTIEAASVALSGQTAREFLVKTLCAVAYSDGMEHEAEREMIESANMRLSPPLVLKPWAEWESYVEEIVDILLDFKG